MSTPDSPKTIEALISRNAPNLIADLEAQFTTNGSFVLPRHIETVSFHNRDDDIGAAYNAYGLAAQLAVSSLRIDLDAFDEVDFTTAESRLQCIYRYPTALEYMIERPTTRKVATKFFPDITPPKSTLAKELITAIFGSTLQTLDDALRQGFLDKSVQR